MKTAIVAKIDCGLAAIVVLLPIISVVVYVAGFFMSPGPYIEEQPTDADAGKRQWRSTPVPAYEFGYTVNIQVFRKDRAAFARFLRSDVLKRGGLPYAYYSKYKRTYIVPRRYAERIADLHTRDKMPHQRLYEPGIDPMYVEWVEHQRASVSVRSHEPADTKITVHVHTMYVPRLSMVWFALMSGPVWMASLASWGTLQSRQDCRQHCSDGGV